MSHLFKALKHLNNLVGADVFSSLASDAELYANRVCHDAWEFSYNALGVRHTGEHASPSQKRVFAT
jgi:hypothetical protein